MLWHDFIDAAECPLPEWTPPYTTDELGLALLDLSIAWRPYYPEVPESTWPPVRDRSQWPPR